ncbi:MAG: transglutaminase domain-containing protein [Desulfobacterales bacterium]|nr:transglutaminase domain-containing protein [Desulfobacterales bacterium]
MFRISRAIFVIVLAVLASAPCSAAPSKGFTKIGEEKFDDWKICRSRCQGKDGFLQWLSLRKEFRPALAFESLGSNKGKAWRLGAEFAEKYPDRTRCAKRIFTHVRNNISYMTDLDNYGMREFAANADESALAIETRGHHKGDCEDMAFLLGVMYRGAGFRSAIVSAPGHIAVMVHMPGYSKATMDWSLNGESGWIWAEPTGRNNPLGWTPWDLIRGEIMAYELSAEPEIMALPPFNKSIRVEKRRLWHETLLELVTAVVVLAVVFAIILFPKWPRSRAASGARKK